MDIGANDAMVVLEGLTQTQVDAVSDRVRAYLIKCKWQVPLELGETVEKITQDVKAKYPASEGTPL